MTVAGTEKMGDEDVERQRRIGNVEYDDRRTHKTGRKGLKEYRKKKRTSPRIVAICLNTKKIRKDAK